jgi:hypothetical protein
MSTKQNEPKLLVELVPTTCHYSNVRTTVTQEQWDKLRRHSYEKAKHKCEICGGTGKKQGFKHDVECHEIWDYDDENHVQTLIGLISLCPNCHMVKHIGRSITIGKEKICFNQLNKVNNWTQEQTIKHIKESFQKHSERSKHQWKLDISILTREPYNLKIEIPEERIFEVKDYKKKLK